MADTVIAEVSDAAGRAVLAGVAGQTPPEPYVPGSGDKLPAELRLVLTGYVGLAGGLFASALACATAFAFHFRLDGPDYGLLFSLAVGAFFGGAVAGAWVGAVAGVQGIRFSRLLRRPSDPRTATVMASKRGGRTLILDIPPDGTGRGYQSLSEVHLALWLKAGMLVPGETVNVYGGPGGASELLVSSPRWGRAFLGAVRSQLAHHPRLLDEKVSGVTLVDWAAWAASTTFSSTALGFGYNKHEVDLFRSAVRDTFLGVSEPPVKSDDVRGKQFSTRRLREGYDKWQVAAFLDGAGLRLAAMESTDRPAGPSVSGALLAAWAEWADATTFHKPSWVVGGHGLTPREVDAFREEIRDTFLGATRSPVKSDDVRGTQFSSTDDQPGYNKTQVDAFLDAAAIRLAAIESTDRPAGPSVSSAILAGWAAWADSTRFSTRRRREGYDTAEVDAFVDAIRDEFLGVRRLPLTRHTAHGKQFTTTRPGYDMKQVDVFLDKAEPRLTAMRATDKGAT